MYICTYIDAHLREYISLYAYVLRYTHINILDIIYIRDFICMCVCVCFNIVDTVFIDSVSYIYIYIYIYI